MSIQESTKHPLDLLSELEARFAAFHELGRATWEVYCLMEANPDGMAGDPAIPLPLARGLVELGNDFTEAKQRAATWYRQQGGGAR